ncbi:hypothetical protein E4U41_000379 [Claviceps citrina]|nr:hypothetical protein E4U41_000379 [Claviceps citrina]
MKFVSVLLVAAASVGYARRAPDRPVAVYFCDHGTHGNGGCEANGHHTYCCAPNAGGPFVVPRAIFALSKDRKGNSYCANGAGSVCCA